MELNKKNLKSYLLSGYQNTRSKYDLLETFTVSFRKIRYFISENCSTKYPVVAVNGGYKWDRILFQRQRISRAWKVIKANFEIIKRDKREIKKIKQYSIQLFKEAK